MRGVEIFIIINFIKMSRIKVRTRGSGVDGAKGCMTELLVTNYSSTKDVFDALGADEKATWKSTLGDDLFNAFNEGKDAVETQLELEDDIESLWEKCVSSDLAVKE